MASLPPLPLDPAMPEQAADRPEALLQALEACLAGLDRLGAALAAAHLDAALHELRRHLDGQADGGGDHSVSD